MYLCACWIVVPQRFNQHTNTWPITAHNDSTSRQIHDRSQATTISLADKYMTDNRPQRFNKHINTWPITGHNDSTSRQIHGRSQATPIQQAHKYMTDLYLCACWIVVACERSCICLLVESLWPVICHVFECLLNRCCLWSVMYLCACWILVACDPQIHDRSQATTIQQAHEYMTDHRQQRFH
jgi:hypothetical protein